MKAWSNDELNGEVLGNLKFPIVDILILSNMQENCISLHYEKES